MLKEIILSLIGDRLQEVERTVRVSTDHIHGLLSKMKDRITVLEAKVEEINKPFEEKMFDIRLYVERRLSDGDVPVRLTADQILKVLDKTNIQSMVEQEIRDIDFSEEITDAIDTLRDHGQLDDAFSDPKVIRQMAEDEEFMKNLASALAGHEGFVSDLAEAVAESFRKTLLGKIA